MALRAFADGALFAEAIGHGPPRVLALHGWGRRGGDYRQALAGIDALAVDLPGFGASPPPPEPIGAEGYARSIESLLAEFGTPPVVIGHSFGGRVAVCLAASNPGRLRSLILTGTPLVRLGPVRSPSYGFRMVRLLNRVGVVSDQRMEEMRSNRGSVDYRATSGVMRDVLVKVVNESYEPELGRLDTPVTLVWGSEDQEVPVAVAEKALRLIMEGGGEGALEIVPDVGHFLPTEAPETLRLVVERALDQ